MKLATITLPYLYHSRLHRCPPILWKKESISVFYVFSENRCFKMVKSSMFWDIWLFWKWNGFFPLFLAFLFMSQSHFSFLRVTKNYGITKPFLWNYWKTMAEKLSMQESEISEDGWFEYLKNQMIITFDKNA